MRYAAKIAYDGSRFSGWQRQPGVTRETVQEYVEEALELLNKSRTPVVAAGRTDRGVHALGQVISFDVAAPWDPGKLRNALDANLPPSISVIRTAPVTEVFSARRSASWREYLYFVWKDHGCPPQFAPWVWKNTAPWDREAMRSLCSLLRGEHDFGAFCRKADRPPGARRTILSAAVSGKGPLLRFRIRGDSFLTNMIRIILGSMDLVASGKRDLTWFEGLLHGGDRCQAGPTAPASGLFLASVGYSPSPWNDS
ncbi:MAG: tRNA pseudouridine(38-40) synthase TruA [Thermovirgaceae bacterium]|jgi:tRNA pseudouridine38-40 synthase|nr:tRNA pseudouridine(38-40) synthase TruA [Synergistales bacterium]MDI9392722.1 tRNA pseudouridine(38-40) synthase TruA [Synergistota bacterium]HRW87827.1 tRNA pseudouridine(38-40) synthase TruA [Thermovirgaceae bacterium]MDD3133401.1 tRNA pseudouridine(38-40) synthase TruA [Synergistales bacterium]MDD4023597.1 tRNA pseudouridine(38-40) synthase TruA [Synergistales bacterium]